MRSKYWAFVEACEETPSVREVRDLLASSLREIGVDGFAILTHAPLEDLGSLGVLIHTWPAPAIDYLFAGEAHSFDNPLASATDGSIRSFNWPLLNGRGDAARKLQRAWFEGLRNVVGHRYGASQGLKSVIVGASCSITSADRVEADRVRLAMRIANFAYQQVLALQKPVLSEAQQLTPREHQLLYRATILGEKPSDVAKELGVKISTVRALRQKANSRLDSGSQEQAAWRMIESGQLFRSGQKRRSRRH